MVSYNPSIRSVTQIVCRTVSSVIGGYDTDAALDDDDEEREDDLGAELHFDLRARGAAAGTDR